jgi:hypothetical protein
MPGKTDLSWNSWRRLAVAACALLGVVAGAPNSARTPLEPRLAAATDGQREQGRYALRRSEPIPDRVARPDASPRSPGPPRRNRGRERMASDGGASVRWEEPVLIAASGRAFIITEPCGGKRRNGHAAGN